MHSQPSATRPSTRRVVIVEDNADSREMLRSLMELGGHDVFVAEDGEEGLALIQKKCPDLALIDIGLPKMDGYQVVRSLRSQAATRDLKLVAITGYGQPEDRVRSLAAGFNAHLVKPLKLNELSAVLGDWPN